MAMVPMEAPNVLKHVHLIFLHTFESFSDARLYGTENESFLTHFFKVHHKHKSERISLKISPNVTPSLGIMPYVNNTDATKS